MVGSEADVDRLAELLGARVAQHDEHYAFRTRALDRGLRARHLLRQVQPGDVHLEEVARAQRDTVQLERLAVDLRALFQLHALELGRLGAGGEQQRSEQARNHIPRSNRAAWRAPDAPNGIACLRRPDSW